MAAAKTVAKTAARELRLRVGQYNLLCPTYGVKHGEREACAAWTSKTEHGASNWPQRWPALQRVLQRGAPWGLLLLEELEDATRADVTDTLNALGLALVWFDHPGRADALGIAYDETAFRPVATASRPYPPDHPKVVSGRVDLTHTPSGQAVRVVVTHQRGGRAAQLEDLFAFAAADTHDASGGENKSESSESLVTIVGGDFNEDFGERAVKGVRPGFTTLPRSGEELAVSRPPHKLEGAERSGKGLIDYIFVSHSGPGTLALERDDTSRLAMDMSHAACDETGQWPSDHGIEALTLTYCTLLYAPDEDEGKTKL
jgi:hypothetical protein